MPEDKAQAITMKTCNRCGHEWWPKSPIVPLRCPKCISPYWNRERVRNLKSEDQAKSRVKHESPLKALKEKALQMKAQSDLRERGVIK